MENVVNDNVDKKDVKDVKDEDALSVQSYETDDINGWKKEEEVILKEWADNAICYNWMHNKEYEQYNSTYAWFTIPVIIISTITGTANFAVEKIPVDYQSYALMAVGTFNIIAGIVSTIAQFLKVAEIREGHRAASISWDKFYRSIKVELAKSPYDRRPAAEMVKYCKEEFNRLIETSPKISSKYIEKFNKVFQHETNIAKPEICGDIQEIHIFDRGSLKKVHIDKSDVKIDQDIQKEINTVRDNYLKVHGRFPTMSEIMETMTNQVRKRKDSSDSIININIDGT